MRRARSGPGIEEQFGRLADPADILRPVDIGEAQVAIEAVPDIVAIQQMEATAMPPLGGEGLLHQIGDCRLSRSRQAGEPLHSMAGFCPFMLARVALFTSNACR